MYELLTTGLEQSAITRTDDLRKGIQTETSDEGVAVNKEVAV